VWREIDSNDADNDAETESGGQEHHDAIRKPAEGGNGLMFQ